MKEIKKTLLMTLLLGMVCFFTVDVQGLENLPLEGLTREQAAVKIVEVLQLTAVAKSYDTTPSTFVDVSTNKGYITLVQQLGIMSGVGGSKFQPKGMITKDVSGVLNQRLQGVLSKKPKWSHGFYAIQSTGQMELMKQLEAVSFGWAQAAYDGAKSQVMLSTADSSNDFKVPKGFEIPIDYAKANGLETYLMVYYEDKNGEALKFLSNPVMRKKLVDEITKACNGLTKDGVTRGFDGITIDFENFISQDLREPFNVFLKELQGALSQNNKKLNVAIQPNRNFKGYDYKAIGEVADKVILMAHDYEPRKLTEAEKNMGTVYTPITPIKEVYRDLVACLDPVTGVQNKEKVVLQISFGSAQWQVKNGKVIHDYPYRPSYDKINQRVQMPGTKVVYDAVAGNTYATYTENGVTHTIWYEDARSTAVKTQLIQLLDIGGVSYWRLGTIPNFVLK
ncbi:MAG: glycosyl hydrolase family 18 protein [Cellulosilyticaceae bacterium]